MIDFAHARKAMVDNQLRTSNVTDRRLLAVMGEVPRERFVPAVRQPLAYIDEPHPLHGAPGRYLGSPAPFAKLVQLAAIVHTDHVLDLGCGNGYSAAVLGKLAGTVVALGSGFHSCGGCPRCAEELGIANVTVVEGRSRAVQDQGAL